MAFGLDSSSFSGASGQSLQYVVLQVTLKVTVFRQQWSLKKYSLSVINKIHPLGLKQFRSYLINLYFVKKQFKSIIDLNIYGG